MQWVLVAMLAALTGCASLDVTRILRDHEGRNNGTVTIDAPAVTSSGAARLLRELGRLEDTQNGRIEQIGRDSVARGQPTTVTTARGSVTSGQVGFGYGGGNYNVPSGYDPYADPYAMAPGVSPQLLMAAEIARRNGGYLPPLADPSAVPYQPPQGPGPAPAAGDGGERVPCPSDRSPASVAERLACLEKDRTELMLLHPPRRRK